jgi:O-antigen/teichoic acid export membrane protein
VEEGCSDSRMGLAYPPLADAPAASRIQAVRRQASECWALLRLTSFDVSTEAGRSKERYRRVILTALASSVARGAALLTVLVSVPLTVRYLGSERFGLWMTISSFTALLQFADLGMGNGLLNAVSDANGRGDTVAARRYVTSGFYLLFGIAAILVGLFVVAYPLIPWPRVFNVGSAAAIKEAGPAMLVLVVCLALNLPLGIVQRVQLAYQEGYASNLWQAAGSLMALTGVLLAIHFRGGLPWLVLAMSGGPVVALLLNWVAEFGWLKPWLFPQHRFFRLAAAQRIAGAGLMFMILQLATALAFSSDNIVIAQVLGAAAVTQYAVPMRLFSVLGVISALFFLPLWPAYGEAVARGDIAWVKRTLIRSLLLTFVLCGAPAVVLTLMGKTIIRMWVGPQIQPAFHLLLGMGIWAVLAGLGNALAMFLNGANILKFQAVCGSLMAIAAVLLKVWLAHYWGTSGVIWATVFAYTLAAAPMLIYVRSSLRRMGRSSAL